VNVYLRKKEWKQLNLLYNSKFVMGNLKYKNVKVWVSYHKDTLKVNIYND
jgi:hypothetical protein